MESNEEQTTLRLPLDEDSFEQHLFASKLSSSNMAQFCEP